MARRALEPKLKSAADSHFIITQAQQIVMRAPERLWIDVDVFEDAAAKALKTGNVASYETALELYGGDLLPEDLYEEWSTTRREQLLTIYRDLLSKVAQLYQTRGQDQQAIHSLNKLVSSDPANEEAHRQLMRLYAFAGSKHQALIQYRRCCDALRSELDAEPERATMELHETDCCGPGCIAFKV